MKNNNHGFTLVEIILASLLMGFTALTLSSVMNHFFKDTQKISRAFDSTQESGVGSNLLMHDLERSQFSLNTLTVNSVSLESPDNNTFNFFDYRPVAIGASSCLSDTNSSRFLELKLQADGSASANSLTLLVSEKKWKRALMFDPNRHVNSDKHCRESGVDIDPQSDGSFPFASFDTATKTTAVDDEALAQCIQDYELSDFEMTETELQAQASTGVYFYYFSVPQFFSADESDCRQYSYFYLSYFGADDKLLHPLNISGIINSVDPNRSQAAIGNIEYFVGKLPFVMGSGTFFEVQKVKIVRYQVEPGKRNGQSTADLIRYEIDKNGNLIRRFLVAQDIEKVVFTRPNVRSSVINFEIKSKEIAAGPEH
jgi:hypothetical protein